MLITIGVTNVTANSSKDELRLYPETEADHDKTTDLMRRHDTVQFHSFALRGTLRSKKFVVYGFDLDIEMEIISEEFKDRVEGFIMARRMTKRQDGGEAYEI